jgi:1-acyl-sn-glycerol-3-phosphate acyltransferase
MVVSARVRLVSLWVSQVARVLADNCLRVFVVLQLARIGGGQQEAAWHLVTAILMVPAVLLAPCNGAISNSLPKPSVLAGSAVWCCVITSVFALLNGPWLPCWALVVLGAAIYSPTRYALLPAAAVDTHIPLTRINGWIEMGAVAAVVAGMVCALDADGYLVGGYEAAVMLVVTANVLGALTAAPVRFPSDVRRPETAARAIAGFFRDCRRIWGIGEIRFCLLGLALLRGLTTGMAGAVAAATFNGDFQLRDLIGVGGWVLGGAALGSLLAGVQRHPRRVLGLVPIGAGGLALGLVLLALGIWPAPSLCLILGIMGGLVNVPLSATYQVDVPADARGNAMAVRNFADYILIALVAGTTAGLAHFQIINVAGQFWLMAGLAAAAAVFCWWALFREFMELLMELLVWPFHRIRGHGPGLDGFPAAGPCIVVANHSAWLDPVWLAKVLPRRQIPMMTSVFYDLPVMRWLMVNVAHAIRVQTGTFRREVPELKEAVAVLDRGECLMVFPEGAMRRHADRYLRQFGQGIWHILHERPRTPVVACWIEGGWGSYFSYWNGPPTKNKRMDFWRHIDIAVSAPQVLSDEILSEHKNTRAYLMRCCLEARRLLGLEVPALDAVQEGADEPKSNEAVAKRVQWDFATTLPALGIQGVATEPPLHAQGSHADIYINPTDPNLLIKVTDDQQDAANTIAAQALSSANIVRCHAHTREGVVNGTALLVTFVNGSRAPYSTPEFLGLMEGQHGTDPRDQAHMRIMRPDPFRLAILQSHARTSTVELHKLSELFRTIYLLESRLNVFLVDLADNIIDAGQVYVVVDFGR